MSCLDAIGWTYTLQAITIAYDIQLFDTAATVKSVKERRARDFTAWALFNYQWYVSYFKWFLLRRLLTRQYSLHCYVMFDVPVIKNPPDIALPDPLVDPEWYGQIWIRYPLSPRPVSTHFGHLFKACAHIRVIMNDICLQYFGKPASSFQVALDQALGFHSRLKDWQNALPGPLIPERIVYPSHFMLQ